MNSILVFLNKKTWLAVFTDVGLILFITLCLSFFVNLLCRKLYKIFEKTSNFWDEALIEAIRKPILLIIWMEGIVFSLEQINNLLQIENLKLLGAAKATIIVIAIAWFLFGLIKQAEQYWLKISKNKESKVDATTIGAIAKVLNIVVFVLAGLALMQSFGFSINALLAFIGGGGVAAGFAAKDLLANFFGAVMIYMDKPFKVGDWIRSPDKEIEGYVEKISIRATQIRTLDKRPLYVPNSVFNTISIENLSRMSHRRIIENIGLRHEDIELVKKICIDAEKMLRSHKSVDQTQSLFINLNNVTTSSINLLLCVFTKAVDAEDFYKVKQDIMLKVCAIINSHEAKIAQLPSNVVSE